jgi:glycine cleavage system aminomethyltransferase T
MAQIVFGSRVRKSPFFDATITGGVTAFSIYNHMFMPVSYGDPIGEYERVKTGVSMWDVGAERQVEIVGPDATTVAQLVSARRLTDLTVGRARYAPMCGYDGCLINDPIALRLDENRWWLSIADSDMVHWVKGIAGAGGYEAQVFEPDVSPLAIQGPKADDVARTLFDDELVDSLGFFHHRAVELNGIPLVICRSGWSRQGGVELFLTDSTHGQALWDLVMQAGAPYGIAPGTPHQMERIENGLLSYASDTDPDTDPIEAGLGAYVNLDGDFDFIGKQALIARHADPTTRRRLVNVTLDGEMPNPEHPWEALSGGTNIGQVRTATYSPKLDRNVGLALVSVAYAEAGTSFDVDTDGTTLTATVMDVPFGTSL